MSSYNSGFYFYPLYVIMAYRKQVWGLMMLNKDSIRPKNSVKTRMMMRVNTFSERYPRGYLCTALVLMLPGYFFLFLFPWFAFEGISVLVEELPSMNTAEYGLMGQGLTTAVWLLVIVLCLFFSLKIFQLRFPRVQGLRMSKELAPALYSLIAGVRELTRRPTIKDVVLTDQYELYIDATPRLGFPFLMSNTLVIGMPMLQTLSEAQFRGEVMRRLGQCASGRFRPTHWIYRTRLLWCRYQDALQKRKRISELPLRWFFSFYAPLFAGFTVPAARRDELAADVAVLEWLNDRDYFETVKSSAIAEVFLDTCFWRKLYQSLRKNAQITSHVKSDVLSPFEKLEHISGHLKSKEFRRKCLQEAIAEEQNIFNVAPVLRTRMDNIGQSKLRDVPIVEKTAATACVGNARKNYVLIIDKLWRSTTFAHWRAAEKQQRVDIQTVKALSQKSRRRILGVKEMLSYAQIAKRLRGDSLRSSLRKIVKRNFRHLWAASLSWSVFQRKQKTTPPNDIF